MIEFLLVFGTLFAVGAFFVLLGFYFIGVSYGRRSCECQATDWEVVDALVADGMDEDEAVEFARIRPRKNFRRPW